MLYWLKLSDRSTLHLKGPFLKLIKGTGSKEWNKLGVFDRSIESYQQFKYYQNL